MVKESNCTKKLTKILFVVLVIIFLFGLVSPIRAATTVGLGSADSFAVLSGSGITNTGPTTITGDVGTYPTTTESGFGSVTLNGVDHAGDGVTQGAKTDLVTAYINAAGQGPTNPIVADLGGQTLTPGVYNSASGIGLTGTVTLDGQGDPNAVFIFQAGSSLTTISGSNVSLIHSAQSCNVFWQVGSDATLGTGSTFRGTLIALSSITITTSATVDGRILARNGAVTMDTNTITKSICATPTPTPTPTLTPTPDPSATPVATPTPTPLSTSTSASKAMSCPALNYVIPTIIESKRIDADSISVSWGPYAGIDTFIVRYGPTNGNWLYNTNVTGFSTTLNSLPSNQPFWVQVAATDDCSIGTYGDPKFVGGPGLPETGFAPIFLAPICSLMPRI